MEQAYIFKPSDFDRFMTEVKKHVSDELKAMRLNLIEEPICAKEAAAYLKRNVSTLHRKIERGEIPDSIVHRKGSDLYFFKSELQAWIKEKGRK